MSLCIYTKFEVNVTLGNREEGLGEMANPVEEHPASLSEYELLSGEETDKLIRAGLRSPYGMTADDLHIPAPTIKGRLPNAVTSRNSFTAYINKATGVLRIDNLDHPEFWMEIQLGPTILK